MAVNSHDWYGVLSTLQHEYDDYITLTGGLDLRYYKGYHYQEITNLLGGSHFEDFSDINQDRSVRLKEGDMINYHNLGEVMWGGLFAQAEYTTDEYSAFVSTTGSLTNYRRTDYFDYADDDPMQQTDWVDFFCLEPQRRGKLQHDRQSQRVCQRGIFYPRAFLPLGLCGAYKHHQ